ncbi:hypothetical protein [Brevundimonas sp.]|uniref:hypothetical protein n=1 Tax=Brevundimonas sp. TaxID=1871086 RepID=UPI00286AA4F3|nr:hypothetical protein [Brevundimonas sp.]
MGERIIKIHPNQQVSDADLNNIGLFGRESLDHVVRDAVDAGRRYTGFQSLQTSAAQVTVGGGRLYENGKVFFRDDVGGVILDLITVLPAVTRKIVTIVAWGTESDADVEARTFLVDVDTETTQGQMVATQVRRFANIDTVSGVESSDPKVPAIDANLLAIADVVLSPAGVVSVTMREDNKLSSVQGNAEQLRGLQAWRGQAGSRLDVLDTNVAGLSAQVRGLASTSLVLEVARDVARLKELSELPATFSSYDADRFLTPAKTDTAHADNLATVREGVRFPPAAVRVAQLALANAIDPTVIKRGNFVLPKFSEVERIKIDGRDAELSLSQYQYQTTQVVQRTITRELVRFGAEMHPCTNSAWWQSGQYDPTSAVLSRAGETWIVAPEDRARALIDHQFVRTTQYWIDYYEEPYWDYITVTEGVNGALVSQTFLSSEAAWVSAISLPFTRVANTGDLTLILCETEGGKPRLDAAIAKVTIPAADLKTLPALTKVALPLTYLEKGRRYGFAIITAGNHFIATVSGNKNVNGSLFYSTDGAWMQGDVTKDIPFTLHVAQFESPRVEVALQPLQLENGIASISINSDVVTPPGTERFYEVQLADGSWRPIKSYAETLLTGLPPILALRVVLLGTTDVMPGFSVGAASEVTTTRPRLDFKHVSKAHVLPGNCSRIEVTARLENYDEARHDCVAELLCGATFATLETADVVTDQPTPDPKAILRTWRFNTAAPIGQFKIRTKGLTDNALITFHVAERYDLAFTS